MKASFLPEAESEHLKQVAYYEAQQAGLGARYLAEVIAAIEYICEVPHRFPIARPPALRRLGLKRFPFTIFFASWPAWFKSLPLRRIAGVRAIGLIGSDKNGWIVI